MSMVSFIITFLAIFIAFGLGVVVILFTGGKTTFQYLQCKFKRKSKIFVWVDTFTGRESVIGKIEGEVKKGVVSWKFNGEVHLTSITKESVKRWKDIYYMGVNIENPLKAYDIKELGEVPPSTIDLKEFQNLLNRALTQPTLDDDNRNMIIGAFAIGLLVIIALGVAIYFKVDTLTTLVEGLNIL